MILQIEFQKKLFLEKTINLLENWHSQKIENGKKCGTEDHVPPVRAVSRDPGKLSRFADHVSGLLHGTFDFMLARDVRAVLDGRAAFAEIHLHLGHALDAADRVLEEQLAGAAVHAANGNDFLMHKSKRQN